jgi:hypothetical protein
LLDRNIAAIEFLRRTCNVLRITKTRMNSKAINYSDTRDVAAESVVALYRPLRSPSLLHKALLGSHSLFTAWDGSKLVGLAMPSAISE